MAVIHYLLFGLTFVSFFLAVFVYTQNRRDQINQTLALIILAGCLWSFSIGMFLQTANFTTALTWAWIIYIVGAFSAPSFLLFSLIFPPNPQKLLFVHKLLIYAPVLLFPLLVPRQSFITRLEIATHQVTLGPVYLFWMLTFLAYFFSAFFKLFLSYRQAHDLVKAQLRHVLYALLVPGFAASLFNIILPYFGYYQFIWIGPFFLIGMMIFVGFAIIKYQLIDLKIFGRELVSRFLSVVILSSICLTAAYFYGFISRFPIHTAVVFPIVGAMILTVFSFRYLSKVTENFTRRFLVRGGRDPDLVLKNLIETLTSTVGFEKLIEALAIKLVDGLGVKFTAFVLLSEKPSLAHRQYAHPTKNIASDLISLLTQTLQMQDRIIITQDLSNQSLKILLRREEVAVALPLRAQNILSGFLLLGNKPPTDFYTLNELTMLETFASQASFALENTRLFSEITGFNQILEDKIDRATKELKNQLQQLEKANRRLLELDQMKNEFVSIASHELRTPMTIIKNYLWLVLSQVDQKLKSKPKQNLERAYLSTERLIHLVQDMLTVSRIEGKRLEIKPIEFDLNSLCRQLLDELKSKAEEKRLKLLFDSQNQTFIITADKDKIREVLLNLLGNALKFTPPQGQITLGLRKEGRYLNTSIADTGQGINPEDQTKLFQKFARLNNTYASVAESAGTGLGLYIAKKLVNLHHGQIWLKSTVGKGSTFTFSLPLTVHEKNPSN